MEIFFVEFTQRKNSIIGRTAFLSLQINYRDEPTREKAPIVAYTYEFGSKSLNAAFSNLSTMYNGFVGLPHFKVIAKIIGYQVL